MEKSIKEEIEKICDKLEFLIVEDDFDCYYCEIIRKKLDVEITIIRKEFKIK